MSRHIGRFVLAFVPSLWVVASCLAQQAPPEINKPFANPDVADWIKRLESESREVYNNRDAIVQAIGLKPGMAIADVGAGTGLFTRRFADKVGPEGKVYAVDIAPAFLDYIAGEARKRGQGQVQTVLGTQETTSLPGGSIDVAFLCDTYHHLEHHERILASIRRALRPGGRLILVEFDRGAPRATDFVKKHVRADKSQFLGEIRSAGFAAIETVGAPKLGENFFAEFRKTGPAGDTP
jgi:ubiquinone/menaquinone biosynthesis C-methylase UbiE